MTLARTLSGDHVALESAVIDAFASRLAGRVLVESAAGYEQARRVWNGLIDRRPAVIVQCAGRRMSWTRCDSHVTTIC